RVAVHAHSTPLLGVEEDIESLAARVLLHVRLEGLEGGVQLGPLRVRHDHLAARRVVDEGERCCHQNSCPLIRWPITNSAPNASTTSVRKKKAMVAGPAA